MRPKTVLGPVRQHLQKISYIQSFRVCGIPDYLFGSIDQLLD